MEFTTKFKEAFKFSLAFAIVYGIALKVNWMSPSWAGWSVVAIAATSGGGESLQKGLLRISGTLLASIIGVTIISLGAQNRWIFMLLTASWLSFSAYKMLAEKERSYFWFVAGYVTLVITAAGPSSVGGFYIAVFRTLETILGIVVFTLIAVFIWPQNNMGAIKKSVGDLLKTQIKLFKGLYDVSGGSKQIDQLKDSSKLMVKQLGLFNQSLSAEGSENYHVKELKPLWDKYDNLNNDLLRSLDRLFGGIEDLSMVNPQQNRADLDDYFEEINSRFTEISSLISGNQAAILLKEIKLDLKSFNRQDISHFDKAALTIIIAELNTIDTISMEMVNVATNISGFNLSTQKTAVKEIKIQKKSGFSFPVLDIEYLKGSLYVFMVVVFGFFIWFYLNPPGHNMWYILGGVFALIFSGAQQVKTIKLIFPFIIAMFLASLIYVFVLPQLTSFYQLGLLLFTCMFVVQYYLSGAATVVFTVVILQLIAINNPQSYDGSALLNSFLFVAGLMMYLYTMSYIISSPRPEKKFLKLVSRFFKSASYLVSHQVGSENSQSIIQRYKTRFYQHELVSLPSKIKAWGKAIDIKLFPNTNLQQIEEMTNAMDVLIVRMETLMEANKAKDKDNLIELSNSISIWRQRLTKAFDSWDTLPEEGIKGDSSELVVKMMNELEEKLKAIVDENEGKINEEEGIQFYQLLGGYRGLTEATLSFVQVADKLDWKEWKEERFQ